MPDYRKMYLTLFDGVERAVEVLENRRELPAEKATEILVQAQRQCEEIYMETDI